MREQPVSTPPTAAPGAKPRRREARDACLIRWRREVLIHHATANPDPPPSPPPPSPLSICSTHILALSSSISLSLPYKAPSVPTCRPTHPQRLLLLCGPVSFRPHCPFCSPHSCSSCLYASCFSAGLCPSVHTALSDPHTAAHPIFFLSVS